MTTNAARAHQNSDHSLVRQTLRTMGILVVSCVIFVGVLSAIAVAVTSRAVGGSSASPAAQAKETPDASKKPLSI